MEHILILVLSVLLIVDSALVIYWFNKYKTCSKALSITISKQSGFWQRLLMQDIEILELKAKLKDLEGGTE